MGLRTTCGALLRFWRVKIVHLRTIRTPDHKDRNRKTTSTMVCEIGQAHGCAGPAFFSRFSASKKVPRDEKAQNGEAKSVHEVRR